jgi:site-specific DNA recombinase
MLSPREIATMGRKLVIYSRFSSDMQRKESCDDQERKVRKGLEPLDIDHREALVIRDEAESGTVCSRLGFTELLRMIRASEVGILAVDDQSRFSRGDYAYAMIKDLVFNEGRFISVGEGIDTAQDGWELRVQVMELHNSTTIRELGRRVRRGQEGRVLDGNGSAGDYPFGYRSEYVDPNWAASLSNRGPKPKKQVIIHAPEARVVRDIFRWFIDGMSISAITRRLNELQIDKGHRSTKPGWHHQLVRRILGNVKYTGLWPWGRTTTLRDSAGHKRQVAVESEQIVERQRPDLRIIDDETWQIAQHMLRRLHDVYGKKPGQETRAPKTHYTECYPAGLLNSLVVCEQCSARMVVQVGGGRKYLGCPNHRKGTCPTTSRVPVERAEKMLFDTLVTVLRSDAEWFQFAMTAMRKTLDQLSSTVPDALAADETRLAETEEAVANLVDAIANGLEHSVAIRRKLTALEDTAAHLRERIQRQRRLLARPLTMPDDDWIRARFADMATVLKEDQTAAALLLRRLVDKMTAREIKIRGKKRGYIQLRFRIDALSTLAVVLKDRVPSGMVVSAGARGDDAQARPPELTLDLGAPCRMDRWAPKIAELRDKGIPWNEISRITGLAPGNAWTAWKRWLEASKEENTAA